jgi:Protein of unknown function (DUF3592)
MSILFMRIGFSLLFGAAGIYVLRLAVRVVLARREFDRSAVTTEGEIVAFKESRSSSQTDSLTTLVAPVVTFTPQGGSPIRFTSDTALHPNPYSIGQKVRVRYLPNDPAKADLEAVTSSWLALVVLVVLGVVSVTVATLPWLLSPPANG